MGLYAKNDRDKNAEIGRLRKDIEAIEAIDTYTKSEIDSKLATKFETPAANIAEIADPSTATAEDVANKINSVISALKTAGLMEN
jgi:hypothetical protein